MTYRKRLALLVLLDSAIVGAAVFVASWIAYPMMDQVNTTVIVFTSIALLFFYHLFAFIYRLYNKVWAYASVGELMAIAKATTFSIVAAGLVQFMINDFSLYRRMHLVTWMVLILLIGGSRFMWRIVRDRFIANQGTQKRTLIVGAGAAGAMIVRQLKQEHQGDLLPVGFIDDDLAKQRMQLYDVPVVGAVEDIPKIVSQLNIEHIVIAIPSLRNGELKKIVDKCHETDAKVQMLPKIEDLMTGKVSVSHLKNVEVEDLLGRDPIELDIKMIENNITNKTVLITGAGGSIGSEISRQVCRFQPKKILLLGHGEYSIYKIDMELREKYKDTIEIIPIIADVQDRSRIFEVMDIYKPNVVYHAAAHKHVPLMEYNPKEAVKNNVIGTKNVAEAADTYHVETFVLVSTDKAVNPTNVMGSTKRVAEMIIQRLAKSSDTKFVAVRFGNVLGSRGSVIPRFKEQIQAGGPVTVTHPDMTRYFMTIPEASKLVLQASALARGGEIFVLDMGEPVKILDLAKNLIQLSGYSIEEIGIEFTGIRPGEKMYEELLGENEIHKEPVFPKIFIGKSVEVDFDQVDYLLSNYIIFDERYLKDYVISLANGREMERVGIMN
ncbi:polysaccharide biosynthesis protein [Gracilibacillus dipsosauri]|uniref:polysaccharide biosynthesis protein n=1 Tax=Gracilibacillus dipsosauri TaxID=178340 RepID=UPI0024092743